jgi:hypothetical protein
VVDIISKKAVMERRRFARLADQQTASSVARKGLIVNRAQSPPTLVEPMPYQVDGLTAAQKFKTKKIGLTCRCAGSGR